MDSGILSPYIVQNEDVDVVPEVKLGQGHMYSINNDVIMRFFKGRSENRNQSAMHSLRINTLFSLLR